MATGAKRLLIREDHAPPVVGLVLLKEVLGEGHSGSFVGVTEKGLVCRHPPKKSRLVKAAET